MSIRPYLGANVSPISVEEMHHRGLLEEGETLLALFDGVLLDERGRRVGGLSLNDFVALTDQRLITWARGLFSDTVDGFVWKDVDVGDSDTWDPFHGRLSIVFRLPPIAPRSRRIAVKGADAVAAGSDERVLVNTLDYMPAEDLPVLARMIGWIGDQVIAGVSGEALFTAFAAEFPPPERPNPVPRMMQPEPLPPPPPPPVKRPWWKGKGNQEEAPPVVSSPEDLIAAYERGRGGEPVPPGVGRSTGAYPPTPSGVLPEQPSIYGFSRALRLMLEVPRKLSKGINRAQEVVSGASELIDGIQDPNVRRTAIHGLRQTLEQQEEQQGPLAPVAPVVRAVLRFSEPDEPPAQEETPAARRIQVKAAVRQRQPVAEPEAEELPANEPPTPNPAVQAGAAVRRQISLRRTEPVSSNGNGNGNGNGAYRTAMEELPDDTAAATEPPVRMPVRRIAVNRTEPTDQ